LLLIIWTIPKSMRALSNTILANAILCAGLFTIRITNMGYSPYSEHVRLFGINLLLKIVRIYF